jgi:hypothetical protein
MCYRPVGRDCPFICRICCCEHCTCLACPYFCPLPCSLTDEQLEAVDVGIIHIKPVVTKAPPVGEGLAAPLTAEIAREPGAASSPPPVQAVPVQVRKREASPDSRMNEWGATGDSDIP